MTTDPQFQKEYTLRLTLQLQQHLQQHHPHYHTHRQPNNTLTIHNTTTQHPWNNLQQALQQLHQHLQ